MTAPVHCRKCGKILVERSREYVYDRNTGRRKLSEIHVGCSLPLWLGELLGHDYLYSFASGRQWFREPGDGDL